MPTTTIGSFPQTAEIRKARASLNKGEISYEKYESFMQESIIECIKIQEELDLDVLVHGEPERNDMVQYFGELLSGFAFTTFGWVQSYGTRCVKPPIIFGDVERPKAMTVKWSQFAQQNTKKVMKGMLTGPVTILQWSFVRDDQPRKDTCYQIALAIRDEVKDLEEAGIRVIQVDEAAFREGLPVRRAKWNEYLKWAVDRMMNKLSGVNSDKILEIALNEAKDICEEDVKFCENIGLNGLKIIEEIYNKKKDTVNILTHCNAGWLATINWGTATSPIYHAHKKGIPVHVWADETRPRNQGANLTSYELNEEGIKNTIIADNTGGILMQRGEVDMCIVGTDRTLANGDVCNKVGTYLKALAAHDNKIPFYVALPSSTIDWNIKDHKDIPIEERNSEELSHVEGLDEKGNVKKIQIYPKKSKAMNLAFDVTPAKYVTGLITEKGICEASERGLKELFK